MKETHRGCSLGVLCGGRQTMRISRGNCGLTVREVADEVGISIGSCHQIFTEKPQMRRVSAKFMSRLLNDDQKENHVEISQELLANADGNENFLKNKR